MPVSDGGNEPPGVPLELNDTLYIAADNGDTLPFEVVGLLEDPDDGTKYAVLRRETADADGDEFIVTDESGNLLSDERLAQDVLDDFLAFADESDEHGALSGEPS